MPHKAVEVGRYQFTGETARSFIDLLSRMTQYFPTPESVKLTTEGIGETEAQRGRS